MWTDSKSETKGKACRPARFSCIVVQTAEGVTVYNYENKKQTEAAYDALMEWIETE